MTAPLGGMPGYEHALRAIGRHLDSEIAYHARILEVEDGFTVQFQPSLQGEARTSHLPWDRLQDLLIFNTAARGVGGKRRRNTGVWANIQGGRENFFRALGHKLDEEGASAVSVDELPDGIALSYVTPDPQDALRTNKHHSMLRVEDMRDIQALAERRRQQSMRALG